MTSSPKRFLVAFVAVVLATLLGVVVINLLVDPYGIYETQVLARLLPNKPQQLFHDRMVQAQRISRQKPRVLLLGTSRSQTGLDPASSAFVGRTPVTNAALSGGRPYEALRYLQHADAVGEVELVVMGLDFPAFNALSGANPEFAEERLAAHADGTPNERFWLHDLGPTLLSLDALRDSVGTIRRQNTTSFFSSNGRRHPATFERRLAELGPRRLIQDTETDYLKQYACYRLTLRSGEVPALAHLRSMLELARSRAIDVRLFTSPSHARSLLLVREAGLWGTYEKWLRQVAKMASELSVPLWDFAGADRRFTAEPLPAWNAHEARLSWHWESAHYKRELGDLVLSVILRGEASGPEAFGREVKVENVDRVLYAQRAELDTYAAEHPDEVGEIRRLASDVFAELRGRADCDPELLLDPRPEAVVDREAP